MLQTRQAPHRSNAIVLLLSQAFLLELSPDGEAVTTAMFVAW